MKLILSVFSVLLFLLPKPALSSVTVVPLRANDKTIDNFKFVGMMMNVNNASCGSGTVIGDGSFVLTARHVVTHNGSDTGMLLDGSNFVFVIGDKSYRVLNVYGHPSADIAIVKIDGVCEKTAKISYSKSFAGKEFYGAGFGKSASKAKFDCVDWDVEYGTERFYKNRIDIESINLKIVDNNIIMTRIFIFELSDPATLGQKDGAIDGEGMHGPGDSGGGIFILEDGELHVFGVISALTLKPPYAGFIHDVSSCREWIENIVKNAFATPNNQVPNKQNIQIGNIGEALIESSPKNDISMLPFIINERRRRRTPPFDEMPF